ncbi:MAG: hypothetical protein ABI867_06215 [Kofleriaceae bacterium]
MQPAPTVIAALLAGCAASPEPATGPELTGETFSIAWGPLEIEPGGEGTRCVTLDVGNATAVQIHQLHNELAASSHHLIVYRLDDPAAVVSPEPVECTPFAGTLSPSAGAVPLMITQKHDDLLDLPSGVGYTFAPNQKIRLELHYFNATDQVATAQATSTFAVGTPELIHDEASFLFIGTPDIELAPGSMSTVAAYFTLPPALAESNFYAITGHTHALGTGVRVATAPSREGERTSVYGPAPFLWSEPATEYHAPAFQLPEGGGFDFACDFHNVTSATVTFGESATDEMCFFWAYYYPSQGARMCVHSTIVGGPDGLDVCCPADRGDSLSEYVCAQLAGE